MSRYNKIVIGIDQSYTRTGISVSADGEIKNISYVAFEPSDLKSEKRKKVTNVLTKIIEKNQHKAKQMIVIVERIRQFSQGNLSMDYIKSTGALIGAIVDCAADYGIHVYSVDTRAWKGAVVGNSKPEANKYYVDPHKWPTLKWLMKVKHIDEMVLMTEVSKRTKNYAKEIDGKKYKYNDDAADSACISLYGFQKKRLLKRED